MSRPGVQSSEQRIIHQADLSDLRDRHAGQQIVLASGCFDIIHKGHIYFLKAAATQGDILVVGVNSDRSVRGLKGPSRPIVVAADRCAVLAELACVDYVFTYDEPCAGASIRLLRPNVFAVGVDSIGHYPDEIEAARAVGSRVYEIAKTPSSSTSSIIKLIRGQTWKHGERVT